MGYMELEFFVRLCLAGVCGGLIGYERKRNMKEAGVRTHFIVAMAAALVMLVSKYGFADVASLPGHSVDVSRVAASIVSGVGFLGAGIIFVRKYTINGLTTAAGIWATSAVGMAIGGGMYAVGIMGTLIILLAQVFLHRRWVLLHLPVTEQIRFIMKNTDHAVTELRETLESHQVQVLNVKMEVEESGFIVLDLTVKLPKHFDSFAVVEMFRNNPDIKSVDI